MRPRWYFTILEKFGGASTGRESYSWSTEGKQILLHANFLSYNRISFSFSAPPLHHSSSLSFSLPLLSTPLSLYLSFPIAIVFMTYHSISYNVTKNDIIDNIFILIIAFFSKHLLLFFFISEFFSATEITKARLEWQWNSPFASRYSKLRKSRGTGCIQEWWVIFPIIILFLIILRFCGWRLWWKLDIHRFDRCEYFF